MIISLGAGTKHYLSAATAKMNRNS